MSSDFPGLESFNGDDLIMSATSYYLGRRTISVDAHCQCLIRAWPRLSENVRKYVQRIVEDAFRRESILMSMDPAFNPFGDACDRESWVNVRKCWTENTSGVDARCSYQNNFRKTVCRVVDSCRYSVYTSGVRRKKTNGRNGNGQV